jgi:predicted N-acetyltransferase YhbS
MLPRLRSARLSDIPAILAVESAAEQLFHDAGVAIGTTASGPEDVDEYTAAIAEGRVIVAVDAADRVIGLALLDTIDGVRHLEELDVHPDHQRQGIGRRLVLAALDGAPAVTLSTFRDLAWNGPFYARMGFRELAPEEWTPGLAALRIYETEHGLDTAIRCLMRWDAT